MSAKILWGVIDLMRTVNTTDFTAAVADAGKLTILTPSEFVRHIRAVLTKHLAT